MWLTKVIEQVGPDVTQDQLKDFLWDTLKSGQVCTYYAKEKKNSSRATSDGQCLELSKCTRDVFILRLKPLTKYATSLQC